MSELVPLREDDLVFLRGGARFDPQALAMAVEPLGFEAFVASRFDIVSSEIQRLLVDHGVSHVWQLARLQEAVLPSTPRSRPALIRVLVGMIANLAPRRDFVVVDRFLLPKATPQYLDDLTALLAPVARSVGKITLITATHDPVTLAAIEGRLAADSPGCQLEHKTSDEYHDRFWIADRARGLFVGTSINGIGVRYALADFLVPEDVAEIVKHLEAGGLAP